MKANWTSMGAVMMGVLAVSSTASAEEQSRDQATDEAKATPSDLAPATHGVELTVGTGYEQGFGKFASGQPSLTDVGIAGGAVQLGVGYRIIPQLTLGVYGSGATFGRGGQVDSSANLYSAAAGVQVDWHFLPARHQLDPWVSLGSGWRGYWITENAGNSSLQGLELAKLQVGLDYRIDSAVSISPVVGADLSTFLTQSTAESNGFRNVSSPQVNTFVFAGLMGRFDIPTGSRSTIASR